MREFDYLIVGAGLSGMVTAECLSRRGKSCLVIDQRTHLGGNCYDQHDRNGVLYHVYGPHYFRTSRPEVRSYLSRFTEWIEAVYRVRVSSRDRLWSFPINLETYEQWIGRPGSEDEFRAYLAALPKPATMENSRDFIVSRVGTELYRLLYEGYTRKQWGRPAEELDASVGKRIPIRTDRDDRYFSEDFQALPAEGYTVMFQKLWETTLRQEPRSQMQLATSYGEIRKSQIRYGHVVYTGPLDEYFDHRLGHLPYRSLRFNLERHEPEALRQGAHPGFAQPYLQINYADDVPYTRTVEVKHITGQRTAHSTVVREFPQEHIPGRNELYYPIPTPATAALARDYGALAQAERRTTFLGRMALYRYINMDQVVWEALCQSESLTAG
jgi:UDP-galactopyranose mutase